MRILVAYATKHGSTREVADAIARTLRDDGHAADVVAAVGVRELAGYDGVVLGGSIYTGRWHGDAVQFLRRHADALDELPLAVFALGPKTLAEHDVAASREQLDAALAKVDAEPQAVAIFGGVVDPTKLHFPFSRLSASDARDWDAIAAWARAFATTAAPGPALV